jgi:hypothetical protein
MLMGQVFSSGFASAYRVVPASGKRLPSMHQIWGQADDRGNGKSCDCGGNRKIMVDRKMFMRNILA